VSISRERGIKRVAGVGLSANRVRGKALAAPVSEPDLPPCVRSLHIDGTSGCLGSVAGESTGIIVGL
jgi:hypothetical protein